MNAIGEVFDENICGELKCRGENGFEILRGSVCERVLAGQGQGFQISE